MTVGIDDIHGYVARAYLDVEDLFEARGLDTARLPNLRMQSKSVNLPCEDPVTNGVNAAAPLLARMADQDKADIEVLVVGTESGLDFGKPISTYIHHLLGLGPNCRSFEVKHACYGGTAALQTAAAMVATSTNPNARALVICTDASARIDVDSYWEPSQGAGAVAMVVARDPSILELDLGRSGLHTFHVMDTLRPRPDMEAGDSDLSLLSYLTCLDECFKDYCAKNQGTVLHQFDHLVFHTPFAGMVVGAHRNLLRRHGDYRRDEVSEHFSKTTAASLEFAQKVGNTYGASVYLALSSMLATGRVSPGQRAGIFSYGSGCGSEFYSGTFAQGCASALGPQQMAMSIDSRIKLDMGTYELVSKLAEDRFSGVENADLEPGQYQELYQKCLAGRGLTVLTSIKNFERIYDFT